MEGRGEVIVLSSNNYLGLAAHPEVVRAGVEGLERYGAGTASVVHLRTFALHHEPEQLAELSGTEAALTYVSCWNANEAVIPTLTDETTVILTDELNHASLIDAIRLSRPAQKVIYLHSDMRAGDGPRRARASCRHRRRVLDGRRPREAPRDRRARRRARRGRRRRRLPRRRRARRDRGTIEHYGLLGEGRRDHGDAR